MRKVTARPQRAPVIRAVTYESFLARQAALERATRGERTMDALLVDLFAVCRRLDRAIERVLGRLFGGADTTR